MGRAALGAAAKSKTGSVRVTETENTYFTRTYGSLGKFLQAKVNEELVKARQMEEAREYARRDALQRTAADPRQVMK